jgi:chromosome segregation ATPase
MSNEDHVTRLSVELGELRGVVKGVDGKVDDLRTGMAQLSQAMASVVRLEVKHDTAAMNMQSMRDRQDLLDKRIDSIETEMPQLRETRQWVVRAMVTVVGVVIMAVIGLVIVKG